MRRFRGDQRLAPSPGAGRGGEPRRLPRSGWRGNWELALMIGATLSALPLLPLVAEEAPGDGISWEARYGLSALMYCLPSSDPADPVLAILNRITGNDVRILTPGDAELARQVIAWREAHGTFFNSWAEILEIPGITAAHLARLNAALSNASWAGITAWTADPGLAWLNLATIVEIENIPGLRASVARALAERREQQGGFTSWEQVDAVRGVGAATLQRIRDAAAAASRRSPAVVAFPIAPDAVRVALTWDADADLDLEIWDESGARMLTRAAAFCGTDQAAARGDTEWFSFQRYGDRDFSRGAYVVSVYNGSPHTAATATLTVITPDGRRAVRERRLGAEARTDQWHAFRIEAADGRFIELDESH